MLFHFSHQFPSPGGGSYYLGDNGTPWKERSRETWITSRIIGRVAGWAATPGHGLEWSRLITLWAMSAYASNEEAAKDIDLAEKLLNEYGIKLVLIVKF